MQADMVIVNAEIVTMDKRKPEAEGVAVKDGKIIHVGTSDQTDRLVGKGTIVIDLHDKAVIPGLIDTHAHMMALVNPFPWLDLRNVASIREIQKQLKAKISETAPRKWILGRGWDQDKLEERRYPTRWDLDKVAPENPVLLSRVCGHVGVANSRALEIAKINKKTAVSWSDLIAKDAESGEPTGVLFEKARDLVWDLPEPNEDDLLRACHLACIEAAKAGLTSVHWFAYKPNEVNALQTLRKRGELPVRINVVVHADYFDDFKNRFLDDPFLRLRCIKILIDGSLGARTAALQEPYADDPSTKGLLNYRLAELKRMIKNVNGAGFQVAVHAIGDLAVGETVKAFGESLDKSAIVENRHRVEHASVLNPGLIKQLRALGLLVCVQPHFVVSDFWLTKRLGGARARWAYPFKSLIESGILVGGSSDAPAEPISPLLGVWAAVARKSFPQERVSVEEALEAYTINAAYFSFEEKLKGSIEVGKFADFTVLSENLLRIKPDRIRDIKVEMTIVGGKIVYSAAE